MVAIVRVPVESSLATGSVNVWHWEIPNSAPITEVGEVTAALDTFYTAIAGVLFVQTFTIGTRCVTVDQNPNVIIPANTGSATATGVGVSVLSAAAVLSLGSYVVGGTHRGRVYLGPLDQGAVQSNGRQLGTSEQSTINSAAGALLTPTASGCRLVVWSRKNNTATVVTSVSTALQLGTQRRRLS